MAKDDFVLAFIQSTRPRVESDVAKKCEKRIAETFDYIMMNLQILAMHNMTVSEETFENSTSIRIVFFRNYLSLYYEEEAEEYVEMLENIAERYENRITNLILECFSELENRADNIYEVIDRISPESLDIKALLKPMIE